MFHQSNSVIRLFFSVVSLLAIATVPAWTQEKMTFNFGSHRYPVIFSGDSIETSADIKTVSNFGPLFGATRNAVNPAPVQVESRQLRFTVPGEYYLTVNRQQGIKVLVLDPKLPISENVAVIFDFCVANLFFCNGHDPKWNQDGNAYIRHWFLSDRPGALYCGPTAELFRRVVWDRFQLPSRIVTFPGTFKENDKIHHITHNVAEIYLPDKNHFVLFDINNAFFVKWKSGLQIAKLLRKYSNSTATIPQAVAGTIPWEIHNPPLSFRAVNPNCNQNQSLTFEVKPEDISSEPISSSWFSVPGQSSSGAIPQLYYGGVAYFGSKGYGTSFLGKYTFASLFVRPELEKSAVEWVNSFGLEVNVVSPEELERELDRGLQLRLANPLSPDAR